MTVYTYTPAEAQIIASLASANGDTAKLLDEHFRAGRMSMAACMKWAADQAASGKPETKITPKVSAKGAVSLYGFGRWPVTLYVTQLERLLDMADELRAWIASSPFEYYTGEGDKAKRCGPTDEGARIVKLVRQ